jgi:hypothetical protein
MMEPRTYLKLAALTVLGVAYMLLAKQIRSLKQSKSVKEALDERNRRGRI